MTPQHVKKLHHNDKADTTQTALPEPILSDDVYERITTRAYELYLARGCRQGCDVEDWVDAEREIRRLSKVKV